MIIKYVFIVLLFSDHLSFSINRLVKQQHQHNQRPLNPAPSEESVNVDSDDEDNNNTYNHNNNIADETELKRCSMLDAGQMSPESGRGGGKSHSRCSSRSRFESRSGSESPELEVDSPPASPALRIHDEGRLMSHTLLVSSYSEFIVEFMLISISYPP